MVPVGSIIKSARFDLQDKPFFLANEQQKTRATAFAVVSFQARLWRHFMRRKVFRKRKPRQTTFSWTLFVVAALQVRCCSARPVFIAHPNGKSPMPPSPFPRATGLYLERRRTSAQVKLSSVRSQSQELVSRGQSLPRAPLPALPTAHLWPAVFTRTPGPTTRTPLRSPPARNNSFPVHLEKAP